MAISGDANDVKSGENIVPILANYPTVHLRPPIRTTSKEDNGIWPDSQKLFQRTHNGSQYFPAIAIIRYCLIADHITIRIIIAKSQIPDAQISQMRILNSFYDFAFRPFTGKLKL